MCRILVIDDEEEVKERIVRRLTREGYRVSSTDNKEEGIRLVRDAEPSFDIVITDMVMESQNSGLEVLHAALMRDVFTEVMVLTAYGNVANAVEAMKRGAFDYIEKNIPGVDVYELMSLKIEQALERRRSSVNTMRRVEQFGRKRKGSQTRVKES